MSASWGQSPINRKGAPAGEKNLEQQLLALSPENPVGGAEGVPPKSALRGTLPGVAPGVPPRSALRGTSLRNTLRERRAVCAIGAFDGVHLGHRALIARAREEALARGDELVVVTFSPDPSVVLCPERPQKLLLSDEDRLAALRSVEGVDRVVVLGFTPQLAALPYERFVRETLGALVDLDCIVVGSDFRLGAGGAGTVAALSELGRADGFDVIGMDLIDEGGAPVTATRIRALLGEGRVEAAAGLLGRCHVVRGEVEHGRGEGTGFGFPTANVRVPESLRLPAEGVYAGYVTCGDTAWPAAINVGKPRSFSPGEEGASFLEATLLGFEGDLYGASVAVSFVRWLREPRSFSSVEELERVVLGNVSWVRATLGGRGISLRGEALA
ncbi:bifunctional riboflavin kinase/FMN adenylyltransferase [Thermophilibacter sp.]|uniref:bifunctional riboflavin kinase/FMN adenylyltransferase n=1 Tax=Thermophilibacter sp. TaxID=2847309 RepID=UPI003A9185CD